MTAPLQNPEKELRFTRVQQAMVFWLFAAVMVAAAMTLLATSIYREVNPELPHPMWAVLPIALALVATKVAVRLTRHAYLILSPLGIEIFPFFKPEKGMQVMYWQEIASAEVDPKMRRLTLHRDAAKTSGVHLSLSPIPRDRRALLVRAVKQRVAPGDRVE